MPDPRFDTRPSVPRPDDADVYKAKHAIMRELSRLPDGQGMFADDLVAALKAKGFVESAIRWAIHEGRAGCVWHVSNLMRQGIDEDGVPRRREGQYIQPATNTPPCAVDLSGPCPLVFGVQKKPLTEREEKAVRLLLGVYPKGLSTNKLRRAFGTGDPVAVLRDLRKKDADWRRAINRPGKSHSGVEYGLAADQ
jgi:hypothetical protein